MMNNTLLHQDSFVCGEDKSVACRPLVHSVTADCFSFLKANPVKSFGADYNAALYCPAMVSLSIAEFKFLNFDS